MQLALKIDVDTLAAARDAVPQLVDLLQRREADATFFFNLGPDRSGVAGGKLFQTGEYRPQQRMNQRLGGAHGAARLYGTLLPAPLMAMRAAQAMQAVQQIGYETGLMAWDRVNWIKQIATADEAWIKTQLDTAQAAYVEVFGVSAASMAAPGWRSSRAALRLQQRMGLRYGSDCRGTSPFLPVVDGEPVAVPQLPTTLAPLTELIGANSITENDVVPFLMTKTAKRRSGHVFTIRASADTGLRLPVLEAVLAGWREQGYELVSLRRLQESLDRANLPWCAVEQRQWNAYDGKLVTQGESFPG
jgi:peptidoglycan/xylan/chitin deacetylase (PgdA/CDA1 family)